MLAQSRVGLCFKIDPLGYSDRLNLGVRERHNDDSTFLWGKIQNCGSKLEFQRQMALLCNPD